MTDRFQCEVRHLLTLVANRKQDEYLELVAKKRGKPEADRLRLEAKKQWIAGSRGTWGDWHE